MPRPGRVWSGSPLRTPSPSDFCFQTWQGEGPAPLPSGVARAPSTVKAMRNLRGKAPRQAGGPGWPPPEGSPERRAAAAPEALNHPPPPRVTRASGPAPAWACTPPPDGSPGRQINGLRVPPPPSRSPRPGHRSIAARRGALYPPPPPSHASNGAPCRPVPPPHPPSRQEHPRGYLPHLAGAMRAFAMRRAP